MPRTRRSVSLAKETLRKASIAWEATKTFVTTQESGTAMMILLNNERPFPGEQSKVSI